MLGIIPSLPARPDHLHHQPRLAGRRRPRL